MHKTQLASAGGTSSEPKVIDLNELKQCLLTGYYSDDDFDEDEMVDALIRSEMGEDK